ncbi:S8 family serine peptidase [Ideonella sp. TBM-1]|uniref:S8 family serine peptidase n=2 Tax=Ideonella livida TaxID=2707176 RepID=A0A7C9PG21_9BURK|nr:S8 family serine peptidase [Ideonella livida]
MEVLRLDREADAATLGELRQRLAAHPGVLKVEPDRRLRPTAATPVAAPSDPRWPDQWHYHEPAGGINLLPAWALTQGEGVVVAVVDTGVRPHADLSANLVPGYDFIRKKTVAVDGDGRDADPTDPGDGCGPIGKLYGSSWHGTHVAGTVAALTDNALGVAGVAPSARVLPVRVLGCGGGYTSDIAAGVYWAAGGAVKGVPANAHPARVINMSLGGSGACPSFFQRAISEATALGALVVVAAGNDNENASGHNPANCQDVLTVAAVGRQGGKASYSNFGSVVRIAGPGGDGSAGVLSTYNAGFIKPKADSYDELQGTSMATPHVAGVAALVMARHPALTPAQVAQKLVDTARPFPATCRQCGAGIVDAEAAVQ